MPIIPSWKENAKTACSAKGLYTLNNSQKDELCKKAVAQLTKIDIDNKKAEQKLKSLRGK